MRNSCAFNNLSHTPAAHFDPAPQQRCLDHKSLFETIRTQTNKWKLNFYIVSNFVSAPHRQAKSKCRGTVVHLHSELSARERIQQISDISPLHLVCVITTSTSRMCCAQPCFKHCANVRARETKEPNWTETTTTTTLEISTIILSSSFR